MKQESQNYLIKNVKLWTEQGEQPAQDVWVENGRLKAMGSNLAQPSAAVIEGQGHVLLPSGVDAQTHLRVPGQKHKETPETGLKALLRGGYSAALTMPNTQPTIDSVEVLESGRREVAPFEKDFGVRVFWSAAITKRLNTDNLNDFEKLVEAGVRAFTNDGLGVASDQVMDQAFAALEKLNVPLLQHAEFLGHGGSMAPGPIQVKVGAAPYPDEPEWKMVERDLRELKKHPKARYHVLHVSSRRTLALVKAAKEQGLKVTAEVTPHHLYFNTETIDPENKAFKMNPPIRGPEDQEALWDALKSGVLDFVATDHAPHEETMKSGAFDKVAFGTLGLETTIPVLIYGMKKKGLSAKRFVEVFSSKPAEFLGLPSEFGHWRTGETFHGVLIDPKVAEQIYTDKQISSLSKNSCFIGARLPGQILKAFHADKIFSFT